MKSLKRGCVVMSACLLMLSMVISAYAENVVQIPFPEQIPSLVPYYWQAQHILAQGTIFEGLFAYAPDPDGLGGVKVVPAIAESWEVSEDGKVWTITLRKDKQWSNGDPITAHDFEWTNKFLASPEIPDVPLWANHLQHVKNGWGVKGGGIPIDELGVKALDDYTIQFTLANARFDFNCWLVVAGAMPLHRATVEKFGPEEWWKPENFVGSGPYVPLEWEPNTETVLVKNPNYVGEVGNVDKVIVKNFVQGASQLQAYQAGELDVAWIQNVADYTFATKNKKLKEAYHETPSDLFWSGYQLARGFHEVFDDVRVRKAFAMSIDRETLCATVLGGRAFPASKYWTDNDPIGKNMTAISFDPEGAKALLAEAGYPNGEGLPQLKFYITGNMPEVEFVVDQWKKNLGVEVQIENLESGTYWNQYVWANWTPDAEPGFTRMTAPMNSFETGALDKNAGHTLWFYDYSTSVKKQAYDLEQLKNEFLAKEGGLTQEEWDVLVAKKDELVAGRAAIVAQEPSELWTKEMTREPSFSAQFDEVYTNWKNAATDEEKTEFWRYANRMIIGEEVDQLQYNGMNESNRAARRLRLEMLSLPFDEAVEKAPESLQIMQDQYYMVPFAIDKAQYVLRPNISGMMVYKFSWGPQVFNLKYLNVN